MMTFNSCRFTLYILVMTLVCILVSSTFAFADSSGTMNLEDIPTDLEILQSLKADTLNEVMDFEVTLPAVNAKKVLHAWKVEQLHAYKLWLQELGATNADRINFGAGVLYAYKHAEMFGANGNYEAFQDYVTQREIIEYVLYGESENVYCDENGTPLIWEVNMSAKMKKAFNDSIVILQQGGITNICELICECGVCVFFTAETQLGEGYTACLLDESGVISPNMSEKNTKKYQKHLSSILARDILVESIGVAYRQVAQTFDFSTFMQKGEITGNTEVVKDLIASDLNRLLYSWTGTLTFKGMADDMSAQAETYADRYGLSLDSAWILRQIQLMYGILDSLALYQEQ